MTMQTFILSQLSNPSMSEKKSSIKNENHLCSVCQVSTGDFLELDDWSDSCFILCANCEAMSECKDLYGEYNQEYIDANSREGVSIYSPNPRITKIGTSIQENFQETETT